jgi:hypothetical protein
VEINTKQLTGKKETRHEHVKINCNFKRDIFHMEHNLTPDLTLDPAPDLTLDLALDPTLDLAPKMELISDKFEIKNHRQQNKKINR